MTIGGNFHLILCVIWLMKTRWIFTIVCLVWVAALHGQSIFRELYSTWDDRLDQWEVVIEDLDGADQIIRMEQIWPLNNNWEEWRIDGQAIRGTIKTKWRGDFTRWEMRIGNQLFEINQKWRNDPNEWEVRSGDKRYKIETDYRNDANVWIARMQEGVFALFTSYRGDPRDWVVEDYVQESLTDEEKLAMVFISLFQSIPKN